MTAIYTATASDLHLDRRPNLGKSFIGVLRTAYSVYRQRQTLRQLSDAQLNDIGIDRNQAEQESVRGFWDIPAGQRRD